MKNNFFTMLAFLLLGIPHSGFSQTTPAKELYFDIYRNYPPISITKEQLKEAQTLIDLDENFKSSWVREYISVEVTASYKGITKKALGKNDTLTQAQKDLMAAADLGKGISVVVLYMPENNLKHNEMKDMLFTFTVEPEKEATYPGGLQAMNAYLKKNAINKIPPGCFVNYDLSTVKFTVNEKGHVTDSHVFWPSKDEKIDALLLEAICNMPNWKPAEYADGTNVKQEFVLTVGNMENCVVNLLNIRQ